MAWRSDRTVAVSKTHEPTPAAITAQLKQFGVTNVFLAYLREHNHALDQVLLFFQSGGQLGELESMTGYRNAATASNGVNHVPSPTQPTSVQPTTQQAANEPRATTPTPRTRQRSSHQTVSRDELIAHGGLTLLFSVAVLANGVSTVFGVISMVPRGAAWLVGAAVVGVALHIIISRIELAYMQWRYLLSWFVLPLIGAIILDVGTSVQGLLWTAKAAFPLLFANNLPSEIWLWGPLFQNIADRIGGMVRELGGEQVDWSALQPPEWANRAWVILIAVSSLAIASERMLRWSYTRFREGWDRR